MIATSASLGRQAERTAEAIQKERERMEKLRAKKKRAKKTGT